LLSCSSFVRPGSGRAEDDSFASWLVTATLGMLMPEPEARRPAPWSRGSRAATLAGQSDVDQPL
jgi:hypothetical protein